MPNNGHITICPYYRDEKNKSISCQDIFRTFRYLKQKQDWMAKYCDSYSWGECPYAANITAMYERIDKGADMDTEMLKNKVKELKGEHMRVKSMLGKAEKRLEAKDRDIKNLKEKNRKLFQEIKEQHAKVDEGYKRMAELQKDFAELMKIYENRFCYLISKCGDETFNDSDFEEWMKGKTCNLKYEKVDENGKKVYRAEIKEADNSKKN